MCHVKLLYSRFDERFVSFLKHKNVTELSKQQGDRLQVQILSDHGIAPSEAFVYSITLLAAL